MTMILAWDRVSDAALIEVRDGAEQATMPASELQNPHLSRKWRTPEGVTVADIRLDMQISVSCSLLTILGGNLTASAGRVRVMASDASNEPYLYVAGAGSGSYIRAPTATFGPVAELDVRVRLAMAEWATGSGSDAAGRWIASGDQRSWILRVTAAGGLQLFYSRDGVEALSESTGALGFEPWSIHWIRATRSSWDGTIRFYISDDGDAWTQVEGDKAGSAGDLYYAYGAGFDTIGFGAAVMQCESALIYAEIRDGSSIVAAFDPADVADGAASFTSPSSPLREVWTVQGVNAALVGWSLDTGWYSADGGLGANRAPIGDGQAHLRFDATTARYWRVRISDADAVADDNGLPISALEAGRLLLWPHWETRLAFGWSLSRHDPSLILTSHGGQSYVDIRPQHRILRGEFAALTEAEAWGSADVLAAAVGAHADVLVIPQWGGTYVTRQAVFGRLEVSEPIVHEDLGIYRQRFTVQERL